MDSIVGWSQRLWNAWDIRLTIICSLCLQLILQALGSRRRYIKGILIEVIVWSSYLAADWIATLTVSKLTSSAAEPADSTDGTDQANKALTSLWGPLLLLHLGGPDTITAYSIEDTQLWLRHLFGLVSQVAVTVYVAILSWNNSAVSYLTIPMFVAGTIKYSERTWVLWSANKEDQRGLESIEKYASALDLIRDIPGVKLLVVAYFWLQALTPHLANYGGNFSDSERVAYISSEFDKGGDIFELIEYILAFLYDVLYTKSAVIHNWLGYFLRATTFTCVFGVFIGFFAIAKDGYSVINVVITYVLLSFAVAMELYTAVMMIYSEWGILKMIKYCRKPAVSMFIEFLAPRTKNWKRWSNSVTQFSLIGYARHDGNPKYLYRIFKPINMDIRFKKYRCQSHVYQLEDPKERCHIRMFKKNKPKYVQDLTKLKEVILEGVESINETIWEFDKFTQRGELALERNGCSKLNWSINNKDFDKSIIAWHIATDICCNSDGEDGNLDENTKPRKDSANILSNYMMHLLVNHPYMLRIKGGNVMIERTCSHLDTFEKNVSPRISDPEFKKLLQNAELDDDDENAAINGWPEPRSPLIYARIITKSLLSEDKNKMKWDILCGVWVEMLCHAASQCQVSYHVKHLTGGGELLTHVWLLLTIYGLTEKVNEGGPILRKTFAEKRINATQSKGNQGSWLSG